MICQTNVILLLIASFSSAAVLPNIGKTVIVPVAATPVAPAETTKATSMPTTTSSTTSPSVSTQSAITSSTEAVSVSSTTTIVTSNVTESSPSTEQPAASTSTQPPKAPSEPTAAASSTNMDTKPQDENKEKKSAKQTGGKVPDVKLDEEIFPFLHDSPFDFPEGFEDSSYFVDDDSDNFGNDDEEPIFNYNLFGL